MSKTPSTNKTLPRSGKPSVKVPAGLKVSDSSAGVRKTLVPPKTGK
jgi:hypothetical protein